MSERKIPVWVLLATALYMAGNIYVLFGLPTTPPRNSLCGPVGVVGPAAEGHCYKEKPGG